VNDDELLARLRAADPARTHAAAPLDLDHLLEETMTADTAPRTTISAPGQQRRRPLLMAAAAVIVAGIGLPWAITQNGDGNQPPPAAVPLALTVQQNTGAGGVETACAEVDVNTLRQYSTAFEGTVTSVNGDQVNLHVDHWYRGGNVTTVQLSDNHDGQVEFAGQKYETGHSYLIYAKDGQIPSCLFDAEATSQLRRLYDQAYAG
jgi:hypothetical protein